MKKSLLLIVFLIATVKINAQILITGIADGPLTGGIPKVIELFVYEDIPDLSVYGLGLTSNGGGSMSQGFTFPSNSVSSGTFIYVSKDDPSFNAFFGFSPDYISTTVANFNGDDAIGLYKNGSIFDIFGEISVDGTGTVWDYLDGWAYRNNNTGPDGSIFNSSNWTYSGINQLEGGLTNATCISPFPISTFSYGGSVTIPNIPNANSATNISHESFSANWDASSGATTYFMDVSEHSDFTDFVTSYNNLDVGSVTNYLVTGLSANLNYYYRVRASNSAGTSDNSNIVPVTTDVQPSTIVQFKNLAGSVLESGGIYNITLKITYPDPINATSATVNLVSGDDNDLNGFSSQVVTFPAGSSSDQFVTLSINNDGISEPNEIFTFEIVSVSGGYSPAIGLQSQFNLTIFDQVGGNYYDGIDPNKSTFVDDLKNRIRYPYTHVYYSQYDETIIANYESKDNGDGTKSVFCVYSNDEYRYSGTFYWTPTGTFSREHTFAHNWMPTNPADGPIERDEYSDQHHLFPANQDNANAVRSNHPLGIVANITSTFGDSKFGTDINGNIVFEPRDEHKGDAARALLYMVIRYDDIDGYDWSFNWLNDHLVNDSGRDPQSLETLLAWHEQDPPDQWEIGRNDYIQSIQGNRNPFVDHPEWVQFIDFNTVEYKSQNLFFSEYVEGSSDNKALEIFNGTGNSIDLTSENYNVQIFANGATTPNYTIPLSGTLVNGLVYILANSSSDAVILAIADVTTGSVNFNGNDAIALLKGTEIVDVIGQIGFDPGSEWSNNGISTLNMTLRRKASIGKGDPNGLDAFDPSIEWNGYSTDTFDGLGTHALNSGPPTITNLVRSPKIPTADENALISASVNDDGSVGLVKVYYKVNNGSETEISCTNTSGSNFQAEIPNTAYSDGDVLEYWIYAEDGDGAFSTSSREKVFIGTTPIVNLKSIDSEGVLIYNDTYARIAGVATVESGIFSPTSLDVYIQDTNSGINVYKGSSMTTIIRGNNYIVEGMIQQYNGKAELVPDDLTVNIIDGGAGILPKPILLKTNDAGILPDPIIMSISGFLSNAETYEGMLVGIQHLSNTNNGDSWPIIDKDANVEVTDNGGTNVLTLRIDRDTDIDGSTQPTWARDIVGIFNQYDVAAPYTWGYQIQPRDLNDIQADGALPVELTTLNISAVENIVSLEWETATEVNNYGFDVERKNEISDWSKVGFVSGNGNSNSPKNYSFIDNTQKSSGKFSYRLKQIDIDGKFEYSKVVEIEVGIPKEFIVQQNYPNPFNPNTTIEFSLPQKENVSVVIYNMLGEAVKTLVKGNLEAGKYQFDFNAMQISSGTYIYKVTAGSNVSVKKMIVLK